MFMSTMVRDGGGDIYITNAPVGYVKIPFRTYSLLKTCICSASSLNKTISNVQKLWFMLIYLGGQTLHYGNRCINPDISGIRITAKFGIPFRRYIRTIYEAN